MRASVAAPARLALRGGSCPYPPSRGSSAATRAPGAEDECMPRMSSPPMRGSRTVTVGAALTFETVAPADDAPAPLRMHPDAATLLRVIDGLVRLTVGGTERVLGIGDEAIV